LLKIRRTGQQGGEDEGQGAEGGVHGLVREMDTLRRIFSKRTA
jgi:hypothetical protein